MAAETPVVEDYSDDVWWMRLLHGEVVGGTTRDQMLGTMSGISRRLVTAHNGTVRMHAEINDPEIFIWAGVRVVSDKELFEKGGMTDGWGLTLEQVNHGELFCGFGMGGEKPCLVSFELPRRAGGAGQKRVRGAHAGLQGSSLAKAGAHVAFKDVKGDVLRGVIMAFVLYVPPLKGKSKADAFTTEKRAS